MLKNAGNRIFFKLKKDNANKRKWSKFLIIIMLILIIFLGMLIGASLSRFENIVIGKGLAKIAKPILEVRREESILVTASNPKGSYTFEVRNYKENENEIDINEVDMEYYIEIVSQSNDAISFQLFEEGQEVKLVDNRTEKRQLIKGIKQSNSYCLKITYDQKKDATVRPINQNVEIKIHSIQKA